MNIDRYKQTDISTKSDRHTGGQSLDKAGPNQILTQRRTHRLGQTMKQTDTNTHSYSNIPLWAFIYLEAFTSD